MKKRRNCNKHNGKNIFGQSCIAKTVILHKGTAIDQYLTAAADVMNHPEIRMEYTFDLSELSEEDRVQFEKDLMKIFHLQSIYSSKSSFSIAG